MKTFETTDPRVRRIGPDTWIDENDKYVFEAQGGGINVFNLRKTAGRTDPLNETPYAELDAAIAEQLGAVPE